MPTNFDAVFEGGAFRPLNGDDVEFIDGERVRLTVQPIPAGNEADILNLAAQVYQGLSDKEIKEVEQIATDRSSFFSQ